MPIDPLSIQKVEIFRGPEALRFGSQAVGGVVEATNNRIPFAAPLGGWQTQFKSATTTVDRGLEGGGLFDAGTRDFAVHADFYGRRASDYFVPSYPYLFPTDPAPPFNGKQPNSGLHSEVRRSAAPTCSTAAMSAPRSRASPASTGFHPGRGADQRPHRPRADQDHQQGRVSSAVISHRRRALLARRGRVSPRRARPRRCRARRHSRDLQQPCPGGQGGNHLHADDDRARHAGQLDRHAVRPPADRHRGRRRRAARLGPHQSRRRLFLQRAVADRQLAHAAGGRIETVRLDGTSGIFPPTFVPPPDDPILALRRSASRPRASASA